MGVEIIDNGMFRPLGRAFSCRMGFMRTSHALLLRLFHDPQYDFGKARVEYVDRGAPGDRSTSHGIQIRGLQQGGMEIQSGTEMKFIPYHRIRRIAYDGKVLWERVKLNKQQTKKLSGS